MIAMSLALLSLGVFGAHVYDLYLQDKPVTVRSAPRRNFGAR